jgi:FkbM family methyltransferase
MPIFIRKLILQFYRLSGYISYCPTFLVRNETLRFYLPLDHSSYLRDAIHLTSGKREPEELDWLDKIPANATFFDIGSSYGQESLYVASRLKNPPAAIYAFNADPYSSYVFLVNQAVNRTHIHFVMAAVSDREGQTYMVFPSNRYSAPGMPKMFNIGLHVPNVVLDRFCKEHSKWPTHVKIDVDGGELAVVRGMTDLLQRPELVSVFIEIEHKLADEVKKIFAGQGFLLENEVRSPENSNCIFNRRGTSEPIMAENARVQNQRAPATKMVSN